MRMIRHAFRTGFTGALMLWASASSAALITFEGGNWNTFAEHIQYHEDFYNLQGHQSIWEQGDFGISGPSIYTTIGDPNAYSYLSIVGDFGTLFALNRVTVGCLASATENCTVDFIGELGPGGATQVMSTYTVAHSALFNVETVEFGDLFPNLYRLYISPREAGTVIDNIELSDQVPYGPDGGIPEPGTLALLALGLAGLSYSRRKR